MKTGIVLEGGACKGVFTSGVLDVMMEREMTFDYCIGVSAGAGNAMNFKSRQIERAYKIVAGDETPAYYGLHQAKRSGRLVDLDLVYNKLSYEPPLPFDFHAYYESPMECEYTVACCETGFPEYLSETVYQKRLIDIVKASCSMPGICSPVEIDGKHYLDGGIADSMPVFHAMGRGCDRIVLVTTKPPADLHPTDYSRLRHLMSRLYRKKYPLFYEKLMTRVDRYFAQLDEILELEKEGAVLIIRPEQCNVRSMEKDRAKMREYYRHGRAVIERDWEKLEDYLR